ncbi:MAG: hypothetical protein NT062_33075, partial [Proteobacteria bacterium]|nr:hypothetical protein [Pseudomonadota bacterium]
DDEIARLRVEPPALVIDTELDRAPPPIELRVFAQRFDGLEFELFGSWTMTGDLVGELIGNQFHPYNDIGGAAVGRVVLAEGVAEFPIDVTLHGVDASQVTPLDIARFDTAEQRAVPSTLRPGDTILPLDTSLIPIEWTGEPASTFALHEVSIRAPHLDLRTYGYRFGDPSFTLGAAFDHAIATTRAGQDVELRVRSIVGDETIARTQTTRVAIADRHLEGTMIFATGDLIQTFDLRTQWGGVFGFDFFTCVDCRISMEHASGRIGFGSSFGTPSRIADLTTAATIATSATPWESVAFAGDRLVGTWHGRLTLYDAFAARIAAIPVGLDARDPAVSPDGTRLAWISARTNELRIGTLDHLTGAITNQRTLVAASARATHAPDFSADGAWLVYARAQGGDSADPTIAIVATDGSGVTLEVSRDVRDFEARWATPTATCRAGGETVELAWLVMATTRGGNTSAAGLWLAPVDLANRHVSPAFPFLSLVPFVPHVPAFDARVVTPVSAAPFAPSR